MFDVNQASTIFSRDQWTVIFKGAVRCDESLYAPADALLTDWP
jgi:hypothetical protein